MPQKTETITVAGYDESAIIALGHGALESLGWTIKYATEKIIIAYTPRRWNKYDHEITVEASGEQLTITSKHIHGEIADLPGRNKKFIAQFLTAFGSVKASATEEQINGWKEKISSLQTETIAVAEKEIKQSAEVDKVMNLSSGNMYITYGIIAINVLVFIIMVVSGVPLLSPTGLDIIKWGGNYSPLTLSGDWWRLMSSVFVHIGIIHLLFNMYALFMISIYLEPMLGKTRFIAAYLATGVGASLASIWWHDTPVASAGASGAIFGMYGVFLALLSTNLVPKQVRDLQLKNIAIFIAYNLIYGMKSGVDNAAHIGGLVSGLIIGYVYYFGWKGQNVAKKKMVLSALVMLVAMAGAFLYLESNKVGAQVRNQIDSELKTIKYKDGQKMLQKMNEFAEMEIIALEPFNNEALTDKERGIKLGEVSLPEWEKAKNMFSKMKNYDVSDNDKKKIDLLTEYIELRITEANLFKSYYSNKSLVDQGLLSENSEKILAIIEQLKAL